MQMKDQRDAVENNRIFREKYKEYLSNSLQSYAQEKTERLLQDVALDAFMEGWLAAGGAPPYIVNSGNLEEQTPPGKR